MTSIPSPGSIRLDRVSNFRDVGLFCNALSGRRVLKTGVLFRSARPDFATPSDIDLLQHGLKIRTIIDLRSKTEQLQLATSASPSSASPAPIPHPTPSPPSPLPLPTTKINLNGPLFQLRLISLLPFLSACHLILLYLFNHRVPAIRILSKAMAPRGLHGLARDTLLASWYEMRALFVQLARGDNWPVLIHCTQGKDRTGLTVLLLEMLVGVDEAVSERGYMASQRELEGEREGRVREIEEVGLPAEWADCEAGWVQKTRGFVVERWGGAEEYLKWCGVTAQDIGRVRENLAA
ncbi:hypothetical protein CAC42_3065 [Sphaceloma murrayae]|uniref:Tyrosine specific protein phosphatases domain-containing protein n=1 Tax=Sphaceloma murrayae TaxID=2082308 RepID=A0A2K1QRV6_9PEZI|nr:hypothetical protein CAC42_3065 [Sphaceloma murrayae]